MDLFSYEMTPKRVPQASTAENYGIDDLNSGDETDDDECPRKKIPDWAQGIHDTINLCFYLVLQVFRWTTV